MKNYIKPFYILLFCFINQVFFSQNIDIVIDSISKEHFKDKTNVGLSIGIIKNGVIQKNNYGGKYIYNLKDINNTTLFEIGSVTKLYTAFILASLEIENKINRFEFLAKYLPKEITKGKDWASKVRLVDLATHTSGFPQFENTESLINLDGFEENNPYGMFSEDFMLEILKETDTIKEYGEVKYSNFGIGILGYAMAKSENLSFSDLFTKYIIQGQNLKETHLVVPEKFLTDIAIPHRNLEQMPLIQLEGLSPSGSIKTSMSDLLNFLNLHIQKTEENQHIIELVLQNQLKNGKQAVGLGWGIYTIDNETVYFHNGGTYGSSSIVIIVPSKMIGVAILANNNAESKITSYALKIIKEMI